MKNGPDFQKPDTSDLQINSSGSAPDDKAFSNFLKERKNRIKSVPSKKAIK